jgi:hypothetical protein
MELDAATAKRAKMEKEKGAAEKGKDSTSLRAIESMQRAVYSGGGVPRGTGGKIQRLRVKTCGKHRRRKLLAPVTHRYS